MFSKLLLAMTLVGVANAQTCANADGAGGGALSCLTNSQADSGATGTACTGACTTAKDNDKCCTANAGYFSDATADANAVTQCTAVTNAATVTCTSASDSVAVTCNAGSWKNGTACDTCTAVTNAATVTCTNATNSVAATCLDGYTAGTDLKCQPKPEPEPEPAAPSPSPASAEGLGSGSSSSGSMATPAVAMTSLVAMLAYLVQ